MKTLATIGGIMFYIGFLFFFFLGIATVIKFSLLIYATEGLSTFTVFMTSIFVMMLGLLIVDLTNSKDNGKTEDLKK